MKLQVLNYMELIDILDEQENVIRVESRENAHKQGLLHIGIHVVVYNPQKEILTQKRAEIKDSHSGLWDIILGGHVSSGETPEITAPKEVGEEYGIKTDFKNFEFVKKKRFFTENPKINWHDNEINYIYTLKYDGGISDLILQEEEVSEVAFRSLEELREIYNDSMKRLKFCPHDDYQYCFELLDYIEDKFKRDL